GGHTATIREAAGLDGCTTRGTARLSVEGEEGHPLARQPVEAGCRHAAPRTTTIGTRVAITEIVGQDQDDVGLVGNDGGHGPRRSHDAHDGRRGGKDASENAAHHAVPSLGMWRSHRTHRGPPRDLGHGAWPDVQAATLVAAVVDHCVIAFSASPHFHCAAVCKLPPPIRRSTHSPRTMPVSESLSLATTSALPMNG